MARLNIPDDTAAGFEILATLSDTDYERLVALANTLDSEAIVDGLDAAINTKWPDAPETIHKALSAASSLIIGPVEAGEDPEEFIQDLRDTLFALPSFRKLSTADFDKRLKPFLGMQRFALALRAVNVRYDNERNFVQARTLTDIRPIFATSQTAEDESLEVKKAVVVHYLKITYAESGSRGEFYVALDNDDVVSLMDTLSRAQRKAASIDAFLSPMQHQQHRSEDTAS